jgi:membrane-bound ClpP family serine protease
MLPRQASRRFWSVLFILIGAALIFLATKAFVGMILMLLGVVIELLGITIKHK